MNVYEYHRGTFDPIRETARVEHLQRAINDYGRKELVYINGKRQDMMVWQGQLTLYAMEIQDVLQ